MDFRQLTYFSTVYKTLNFTTAANVLHISQQGLSKSIQNLERELDCRLFVRDRKGLKPTPVGEIFYAQAVQLLEGYQRMLTEMEKAKNEHHVLKVGFAASTFGAIKEVDTALIHFKEQYPEISVEIFNETDYVCEEKIEKGELDVAFSMGKFASENIKTCFLREETIYAVLPYTHPLAKKEMLTIADICLEPLITTDRKNKGYQILQEDFAQKKIIPKIAYGTDDIEMHFRLAQKGMGISLLPEHLLELLNDSYQLKALPVEDLQKRQIYLVYKKTDSIPAETQKLLNICRQFFTKN